MAAEETVEVKRLEPIKKANATRIMVASILLATAFGMLMCVFYGGQYSARGALLAFLASGLGFALGGISGFLFGFPRYTDPSAVQSIEDLKAVLGQSGDKSAALAKSRIRQSTNLERITDWLMTMIVGATVVSLKDLTAWAQTQFELLTKAIVYSGMTTIPADADVNSAPGALIVMPFAIGGFLSLYLWARRYLPGEWDNTEKELLDRVEQVLETQKSHDKAISKLETVTYGVDATLLKRFEESMLRFEANRQVVDDVVKRYRGASAYSDDPLAGFGLTESDGFKISAKILEEKDKTENPFSVDLTIERLDGQPFRAVIAVLYHNSFDTPIEFAPFEGQQFTDTLWCEEPFTIGAVLVIEGTNQTVRLAIDLAKAGGPPNFKEKPDTQ
jgi:hypothetical protein